MVENRLPLPVDPVKMTQRGERYDAQVPVQCFERLATYLASDAGHVAVTLQGEIDHAGHPVITGTLNTQLQVTCQRCLTPFDLPITTRFAWAPVTTQAAAKALPTTLDPVMCDEAGLLDVHAVVEDELILNLPAIPRHPTDGCDVKIPASQTGTTDTRQPLAQLKSLFES